MLLIIALLIYLLVVILVFLISYFSGIRKWSALVLGLIIGFIVLLLISAPQKILTEFDGSFLPLLYLAIILLTPVVILFYCLVRIVNDRLCCDHNHSESNEYELTKIE